MIDELELRVVYHSHNNISADGMVLPTDIIGRDGLTFIKWVEADRTYDFAGWEVWHDGMTGGRYQYLDSLLSWVRTAKAIRAGTIQDFSTPVPAPKTAPNLGEI
jgi:hypothetical protein